MKLEFETTLNDCRVELDTIKTAISADRFATTNRFLISYAVIKASGTIESVCKNMIFEKISGGASEEAKEFLRRGIVEASFNPSVGKIKMLLDKTNSAWATEFDNRTKASSDKSNLTSLVTLRNSFAHGDAITATIENVITYFDSGRRIIETVDDILTNIT